MPISSTAKIDTCGFMRPYHSTADMSASAGTTTIYPLNSAPVGATSNSDATWGISADTELNSSYAAYKAFDNASSVDSRWHTTQGTIGADRWISWQKKTAKALVRKIVLKNLYTAPNMPTHLALFGSDDGTNWTEIIAKTALTWSGATGSSLSDCSSATLYAEENLTAYYYHKAVLSTTTAYIELAELNAYSTW